VPGEVTSSRLRAGAASGIDAPRDASGCLSCGSQEGSGATRLGENAGSLEAAVQIRRHLLDGISTRRLYPGCPCLGIPGGPVLRASEAHICTSGPRHSNEDRVRRHIGMHLMRCDQIQIVNIASSTPTSLYCLSHFQNTNKDSATTLRMYDCILPV
jgi:hypothetical protein